MMKFLLEFWKFLVRLCRRKAVKPLVWLKKKEPIHIRVGIDFGTAFTKVAYRELTRNWVKPILFNHRLLSCPQFCLPSVAAIDEQRNLLLGIEAAQLLEGKEWDFGLRRFKVVVAGKYDKSFCDPSSEFAFYQYLKHGFGDDSLVSPEMVTAIYLAYVMNQSRDHLQNLLEYLETKLDLEFNICMPIDYLQNNPVKEAFEKIFAWAELIEHSLRIQKEGFNLLQEAKNLESKASYQPKNPETRVFAVPEAVAQVSSYFASLGKKQGIQALIDFGAGTTDISIFNLTDDRFDERERARFYAAGNIPKGTVSIERIIASCLQNTTGQLPNTNEVLKTLIELTRRENYAEYNENQELDVKIRNELKLLWENTRDIWWNAYSHLRQETCWYEVPLFICGGGAKLRYVLDIFSRPWWDHIQIQRRYQGYKIHTLPVPDNYNEFENKASFERMAVAYGLSYSSWLDFNEYVLPKDATDDTPPPLPVRSYASADGRLYPTTDWLGRR